MKITIRDRQGQDLDLIGSPFHIEGAGMGSFTAPPDLGEHTEQVLRELLHLSESELADLLLTRDLTTQESR